MKIHFSKLRYRNFLSTGNNWIEIIFDQDPLTLIVGSNGAGKTTIIDALTFALFGKAFRNINKPNLVNTINGRDCIVEVEFIINQKNYKVVRGIKVGGYTSVFEIWVNEKMQDQDSKAPDQQKEFERKHLKFNFKAFSQVIVLGSKTYIPFMRLSAADRRSVVEDLLDIQIYSVMMNIIKKKLVDIKSKIIESSNKLDLAKQKVDLVKSNIMHNNAKTLQKVNNNIHEIKKTNEAIEELRKKVRIDEDKISKLSYVDNERTKICNAREPLLEIKTKIENRIEILEKDIDFYKNNDICPTCTQAIDETFKLDILTNKVTKLMDTDQGYVLLQNKISDLTNRLKENGDKLKEINKLRNDLSGYNSQIENYINWIERIQQENDQIQNNTFDNTKNQNDLKVFENDLVAKEEDHNKLLHQRIDLDLASTILKDSGIKSDNIKQYVPVINNYINKYLSFMDFFVNFTLNESFEETIYHRFRDEFSYENFSDGEKLRLDLAILFAWRSVAKVKNSIDSNLLILDEILDSSLDMDGVEDFFKLISSLTGNNLFIISHRDAVVDRFNKVIKFTKIKDFSEMEN